MIVRWRNGNGVIVPKDMEIPQYDLSKVVSKDKRGVYNTGMTQFKLVRLMWMPPGKQ